MYFLNASGCSGSFHLSLPFSPLDLDLGVAHQHRYTFAGSNRSGGKRNNIHSRRPEHTPKAHQTEKSTST